VLIDILDFIDGGEAGTPGTLLTAFDRVITCLIIPYLLDIN
jgi:hypothetical protein